jgi:hypothetical protein
MRMPILSYFLVMGTLLIGVLLWISNVIEPEPSGLMTSQNVGVPKFKAEPESAHARVTAVNFAAEYGRPATKPAKTVEAAPKPKKIVRYSPKPTWNQLAGYPHDDLTIR